MYERLMTVINDGCRIIEASKKFKANEFKKFITDSPHNLHVIILRNVEDVYSQNFIESLSSAYTLDVDVIVVIKSDEIRYNPILEMDSVKAVILDYN